MLTKQVRTRVCNGNIKECTKNIADLRKAPKIQIKLQNIKLLFEGKDYLYFKNDQLECRIGDICAQRQEGVCGPETEVVLGKLFFEKYTPMISVDIQTAKNSVTLITNFESESEHVLGWLIIGLLAVIFGVVTLVYVLIIKHARKRQNQTIAADDTYEYLSDENKSSKSDGEKSE